MHYAKPIIAVVGGRGLVGSHLLDALVMQEHVQTLNLCRPDFDLLDEATWRALPRNMDCVIMAAGLTSGSSVLLIQTNAVATSAFSQFCRKIGVRKFVLLSTGAVYGATAEATHPALLAVPVSDYGKSKLLGEQAVNTEWLSTNVAILRLYYPYGRRQKIPRLIPSLLQSIREGREIVCRPDGGPYASITHVEDLVKVILDDFVFGAKRGTCNVAATNPISIERLSTMLGNAIAVNPKLRRDGISFDTVSQPYLPARWREFNPFDVL